MNAAAESIELHCQKCGHSIHIEAGDAFTREISCVNISTNGPA